jgi:predicted ribosome quality control (RQC) complex YloA/Tae2 family protein
VIRYTGDDLPEKYPETIKDAVCLAALYSKAGGGKASVTLTRCRYVTKPNGVPAGQVRLNGEIILKSVNIKAEAKRFDRLDLTTDRPKAKQQ